MRLRRCRARGWADVGGRSGRGRRGLGTRTPGGVADHLGGELGAAALAVPRKAAAPQPLAAVMARAIYSPYALDGSRYANRYYAEGGGTLMRVHELGLF